jgi:hypothetical protein
VAFLCLLWLAVLQAFAQTAPPASKQVAATAPSTEQMLSSYEGQNVTAIEVAGRPESASTQFAIAFCATKGSTVLKRQSRSDRSRTQGYREVRRGTGSG